MLEPGSTLVWLYTLQKAQAVCWIVQVQLTEMLVLLLPPRPLLLCWVLQLQRLMQLLAEAVPACVQLM